VRASNLPAQRLYEKYGFRPAGIRRRYYSDNNEDAIIMWTERLRDKSVRDRVGKLQAALDADSS
jgi:ribosomal-protein-alanine N-acetyltransferase